MVIVMRLMLFRQPPRPDDGRSCTQAFAPGVNPKSQVHTALGCAGGRAAHGKRDAVYAVLPGEAAGPMKLATNAFA